MENGPKTIKDYAEENEKLKLDISDREMELRAQREDLLEQRARVIDPKDIIFHNFNFTSLNKPHVTALESMVFRNKEFFGWNPGMDKMELAVDKLGSLCLIHQSIVMGEEG